MLGALPLSRRQSTKNTREMATTTYPHIELSADGVPMIAGTRTKVIEVVLDRLAYHWDADEIHRQHAHLSLAQIHAALAYYYDHQRELDDDISRRMRESEDLRAKLESPALRARIKAATRRP